MTTTAIEQWVPVTQEHAHTGKLRSRAAETKTLKALAKDREHVKFESVVKSRRRRALADD